jgi:pentalenene oxygenase
MDSGLVEIRLGPMRVVVICDPQLTHRMLSDDRTFDKGGPLFDVARKVVGDNVITAPYSRHRRQRRLIRPAFLRHRLAGYAVAMVAVSDAAARRWSDGTVIDAVPEMQRITARSFLTAMFTRSLSPHDLDGALADVATIVDGLYRRMLAPAPFDRLPTPGNRRYRRARAGLRALVGDVVAQRRRDGIEHDDLLSSLMGTTLGDRLSEAEIYDQLTAFFIAGTETTAGALSWSLHLLSVHRDVQARVQAEVDDVLAEGSPVHGQVHRLVFTAHVLNEALRLYPPGWLFTRTVTSDTELGGFGLRRGTAVLYSPYLLHRLDRYFDDANTFDPDRWNRTDRCPAFIPFGSGPRQCAGKDFALTEATLALAVIVRRWSLRPGSDSPVRPGLAMGLSPQGLRLLLTARTTTGSTYASPED